VFVLVFATRTQINRRVWREWWQIRQGDLAALACIAVFFFAFFPQVFFSDVYIITGDAYFQSHPMRTVAWNMIRSGQLPLWTPYVLGGYPLLSMAQVAIGYPFTWGYLFLPGLWAEQLYVLVPFFLSPMFTYAYARELGRSRLASLLAGLAFGYGGMMCGFIANSGILTNSLMWAPLVLLFIDRARTRPLTHCLPGAALSYALSVLAGHPQSYVYVGTLAVCYGLFLSLFPPRDGNNSSRWARWKPLVVSIATLLLAAGVAAFQLIESMRAARLSIRSTLTYQRFGEGSYSFRQALLSMVAPLYHYVDTTTYLAPVAIGLAVYGAIWALRQRNQVDSRFWFWSLAAIVAFVLLLGNNTPVHRLIYLIPVLKQFRVPSRHTFEWTLAVSILAAYGWDAIAEYFSRRREEKKHTDRFGLLVAVTLLIADLVIGALWWHATSKPGPPHPTIYTGLSEPAYWVWKFSFAAVTATLLWWCFRMRASLRWRTGLLAAVIMVACFAEPSATISCWWGGRLSLSAARLRLVSPTTRYLQQFPATENRVYTRTELFAEELRSEPRLESANLHALYGLHNLAGMEPLVLDRFSRALGGVGPDSVTPLAGFPPNNEDIFGARSHVLDLLNTTHVVTFSNLKTYEQPIQYKDGAEVTDPDPALSEPLKYKDGVGLAVAELGAVVAPGTSVQLTGARQSADQLAIVSSLTNSTLVNQGAAVAHIRLRTSAGKILEFNLRAGIETSEWAHERPDVRAIIRHQNAPLFESRPGDAGNTFPANRYWARFALGEPQQFTSVEVDNRSQEASLALFQLTLYNSRTGVSSPLFLPVRSAYWQTVYDHTRVQILKNERAMPRAWLVSEAESVDGVEALRRIRGESAHEFDPQRTALLEVPPADLPHLPGGPIAPESKVRIASYEPNQISYDTTAPTPTVLIASEIFYPGWQATVDGNATRIIAADYLLRGIPLPAGQHHVEMRYRVTAARNGAVISALTLISLFLLMFYGRRIEP
jgi:hypothetical protein